MKSMRILIMLAVTGLAGSWLFAAEPAATPQQSKAAAPAADVKGAGDAKAAEQARAAQDAQGEDPAKSEDSTAADKSGNAKSSPQRFVPSEQVRADFDVSFPVDI